MEVYITLGVLVMAGIGGYLWLLYRQQLLSDRYVSLDMLLFLQDKEASKERILGSVLIEADFRHPQAESLVIKQIAVHSTRYTLRKFEQLVFASNEDGGRPKLSVSVYVDRSGQEMRSLMGPYVLLKGVLYLKDGKRILFSTKKRLGFDHDRLQVQV